ncbi:hypothetical protein BWI93_16835 [Siphonobacter sp. BAB-5385]|nr:hypothetical protein BWI93_16835 [Siphonobacter sp. BAB-5385]
MSLKWIVLIIMAGLMIGFISCSSNCPYQVEVTIDASKDTILAIGFCRNGNGSGRAAVTVKGYQDDSSGFILYGSGPLNESFLQLYKDDKVHYKLPPDSVWVKQDWFDSYYDTLYIMYRHKLAKKGKLTFTVYEPSPENLALLPTLPVSK